MNQTILKTWIDRATAAESALAAEKARGDAAMSLLRECLQFGESKTISELRDSSNRAVIRMPIETYERARATLDAAK